MPIRGLTNRTAKVDSDARGRPIRLGYLQKGWREGFGRNIKLHDADYFIFKPIDGEDKGDAMLRIFKGVYGEKPAVIPDVRIPQTIAGNFDIENCAWLTARRHTERGSIFLAMSDGEQIKRHRNPETGKVDYIYDGEMAYADHTAADNKGNPCLRWRDKLYPWQQEMQVDLVLPAFNDALFAEKVAGYGVVTLLTHSTYDIANLISEYHSILDEMAALLANPMIPGDVERAKQYLPLRNFPLRLYRSTDTITTPDYRSDDPGNRLLSTRSLLHWQLSPTIAASMHLAMERRTTLTLEAVANMPLLQAGDEQHRLAQTNNLLFDEPLPDDVPALPAEALKEAAGPDWESFTADLEVVDGEIVEDDPDGVMGDAPETNGKVAPMDWYKEALKAATLNQWAYRAFQTAEGKLWFEDAPEVQRWYTAICGEFNPKRNEAALGAFRNYANSKADGHRTPAKAAKSHFKAMLELDGLDEEE